MLRKKEARLPPPPPHQIHEMPRSKQSWVKSYYFGSLLKVTDL